MPKKKQQQKFPFYKKFLNEIIVGLITLVSLGSIIFLYFSYEDFNTFYLFQDSKEAAAMLKIPEFARHLGTYYLVEPFYKVFGYNPVGYYIFILICAVITSILFYRFLVVLTKQKTLSFLSSIIFASSYYGVEAYYWNMTSGFETALSSAILFIVLLFLLEYLQNKKKLYLIFAIFVYPIFAFLFKAKAFIAILEIFILFALFVDKKTVKQKILSLSPFVLFTGFIFWSNLTGGGNKEHITFNILQILKSFFGSFADLFIPSTVLQSFYDNPSQFTKIITANFTIDQVLFFIGIILFVLAVAFGAYLLKNKKFIFKLYFASFALVVLYIPLAFLAAIIESGLSITTLESVHHILTPITIWSSLLLGISLYVLYEEKRKLAIIMTSLIVLIISLLSMQQILLTVNNKSYKLKNFYSSVLLSVPKINNPYVFYFSSVTPPVLNPFVVGDPAIHQSSYLAGFYHTNYKNIILADNFSDALHKLKENNIPLNRFNYFYTNQQQTKNITKNFISFVNGSSSYAIPLIELTSSNIDKPSFYPYELHFSLEAEPDFSSISINDKNTRYNPYYDLLFRNAQEKSTYTVFSPNAPSSLENSADKSLDNNLNTLWIPKQWEKNGDSLVIDMRAQKSISAVAFETSGAFPWKQRSPTEYTIFTSNDGFSWQQIVHESKNTPLMSGEYLFHSFNPTQARYVKIVITKTYGNFPPAVDEIEIFDNLFSGFNFATYAQVAQNPLQYLPSLDMLQQVYEVLYKNNLSFSIDEKIDADTIWKDERKLLVKLQQNSQNYIVPFPADGYTLKAVHFESASFPLKLTVTNLSLQYIHINQLEAGLE